MKRALATGLAIGGLALADPTTAAEFDYIVVGAGTSGLLVANQLSRDPRYTVAVVDPGADQRRNPNVTDPLLWLNLQATPVNWNYTSVPQADVGGRELEYQAGRGIGGSSLVNGMTYIRGDRAELDAWEELGNPGWNWETMLPYYKKVETFFPPKPWQAAHGVTFEPQYHGETGGLHVGFNPSLPNGTFYARIRDAWAIVGQGHNQDLNSGTTAGFSTWPQTLDPDENKRWDAATAFYWPVDGRRNLQLYNGTVSRILWKGGAVGKPAEAAGVEYVTPEGQKRTLTAKKEVIVSAGSLRTPLVLERSGIGNPRILGALGIETVVDLPGVGEHLVDQPNFFLAYSSDLTLEGYTPYATFVNASALFGDDVAAVAARTKAQIPLWAEQASNASRGGLNAAALTALFEVQHSVIFEKGATVAEILTEAAAGIVGSPFWALLPFSRGSVHLKSADAIDEPAIDPRFLSVDFDLTTQIAIGRLAQKFWAAAPVRASVLEQVLPPSDQLPGEAATDAQWASALRALLSSNSHPVGTAAMMAPGLGGVVDPELRVHGTANVRVVDASVLPMQISGHLTATLYAVAQRASELIVDARG